MSTPGTERYSRIMLTLMNGGTKLTRRFVEKRVKDLSKNGEEDTIDEFLVKNKAVILQNKLGKNKEYVFFPTSGLTNLDYWDLCMFCFILEETCDLSYTTKMRIKKLLKIRNKLCHLNDPTLETIKFDDYTYHLNVSFENCLDEINDEKFTEEMKALVQTLATGPLSIDDTLKAIHKLYHSELTQKEVLEKIGNGQDLTNGKLDTLIEKVERLETRWPSGASEDIPGIGMVIEVGNCSEEKKKEILDTLEKNFNEAILQKVSCPEEDLPNGVLHTLRESVTQVFRDFLIKGRHITFVKQKCLLLTIKCTSVKSFLKLIHDYRTGDLSLQLSGIETAIKSLQGCRNVQLVNLIFKEEFMEVMDDLVSKLYERVQQTEYTSVQTSCNAENSIHVTLKCPTISERETVQNRFKTKMFVDGMKHIETELKRKLNVESLSLTAKLVVADDAVSNFAQQSDSSVVDEKAKVEEETQTKQSRRKAALCEEEDTSTPSLKLQSHLHPGGAPVDVRGDPGTTRIRPGTTRGPTSIPVRAGALKERMFVAAIDFGTTYSGYAFQTRKDFMTDPFRRIILNNWKSSVLGLSYKTPTCILFDKHQQFHSFGNDAEQKYNELAADGETWNWLFFNRFKMTLYKEEALSRDTVITDDKGMGMPAMIVFTQSLKYLKDHLIKTLEKDSIDITPQDIHWVITVPTIWTDSAKQFMREAAINAEIHTDMVSLSLEPEAASLFCRYLPVQRVTGVSQAEIRSFLTGDKYMILDCGGETVDITVHEIQEDSTLKELAKANGGECGGTQVDEKFISLLNDLFGPDVVEVIRQRFREDYFELMQSFEIKKRRIYPALSGTETIRIPVPFAATYKELNNIDIANNPSIPQRLKGKVTFISDKVRVDADVMKDLFTDVCEEICQKAKEIFSSIREHRIDKILMVGGFSESEMLQVKVRETFPGVKLIIPEAPGLAVLKGAVLFGQTPKMITARVCKDTYGIRAFKHFEPGLEPPEKREVQGGFVLCKDYFSKHATIGMEYKKKEIVYTQESVPSEAIGPQGLYSIPVRAGQLKKRMFVAAIDFGTTYSGYAFQTRADFTFEPLQRIITNNWKSSVPGFSHKTPTCILFDKHQQFHSFGNDAEQKYNELAADGETWNWYFFKRFKMTLYKEEALSRDTVIRDDKGMTMPAMIVFTQSLKYLKDHLIKTLEKDSIDINPQDIHWVITVPAIWTDSAKEFMREAAINAEIHRDMVSLSLEPEAASLFCRYLPVQRMTGVSQAKIRSFLTGDKYMILDCGGGTVDITVHEIQEDSTLRELAKANGGECGGTQVDEKFISLLNDLFGPDVMEVICQRFGEDYLDLMQSFEIKKRRISPDLSRTECIKIPVSFAATYKELNNIDFANNPSIPQRLKGKVKLSNEMIRVDADVIKDLFTDACAEICQKAKEFFSSIREHRIDKILMVGGFSESEMLQVKVRETFPGVKLIIPEEAGLAVLKGAVLFGHNPKMITARVCKYSYGIRALKHFEPGLDPPEKREVQGDFVLCKDYFSTHATIGQEYKTEEKVFTQEYVPSEASGSQLAVGVYTSPRKHPLFVDEEGSRKIGEIIIQLQNTKGKDNRFKVQFDFGNTELRVKVTDTVTGHEKDADFDLLVL